MNRPISCKKESYSIVKVFDRLGLSNREPIAVLMVHTNVFEYYNDKSLTEAKIEIRYENLLQNDSYLNNFVLEGGFKRDYFNLNNSGECSLSSKNVTRGDIRIDNFKGNRIGTYFLSKIVEWLKGYGKETEDAVLRPLNLTQSDGKGKNNRIRRNKLYSNIGIPLTFDDNQEISGSSKNVILKDLKVVKSWMKNIEEIDFGNYSRNISLINEQLINEKERLESRIEFLSKRHEDFYKNPLLEGIKVFCHKHTLFIILLILVIFLALFYLSS